MLTVHDLEKSIGNRNILGPISFQVKPGQMLAVMGSNGAGKSTLLKLVAKLTKASAGEINLRGKVGLLSHQPYLYNSLTARENLRLYGSLASKAFEVNDLDKILKRVGLEWESDEEVAGYSRGMQQRLAVARLLVENPEIILLDEPQTGLDQEGLQLLQEVVYQWKQVGKTLLLVTHTGDALFRNVDLLLILDRGQPLYLGESPTDPAAVLTLYHQTLQRGTRTC